MPASSVPPVIFGPNGFEAPSEPDILAGVLADLNAAFGGNMNLSLETPQGQMASSMTAIIGAGNDLFLQYVNDVDPAFSSGRMQDAIGRIYFLSRRPAEPTTVQATCTGLAGVVIPAGALAIATDGNLYAATDGGTIGGGGSVTLAFECTVTGAIACPIDSLNAIYQAIPGWDTITNAAEGVLGNDTESRAAFEARRVQSVAVNALGTLPALRGAVLQVPDVLDAYVTDNPTGSPVTIGGVSIAAHALYVCVAGGVAADVAQAIWTKKPPGCNMTGATTVTVTDTNGYSVPYPTYTIKFQTAAALAIKVAVTILDSAAVPANALALVQGAVEAAFAGTDGGIPARVGATVFASRFYAGIASLGAWAQLVSVLVGTSSPTATSQAVNIDHIATVAAGDITLTLV